MLTLALSIILGFFSDQVDLIGIFFIALFTASVIVFRRRDMSRSNKILSGVALFMLGVGFCMNWIPGFHHLKILDQVKISQDDIPFTMYFYVDKTVMGILILGLLSPLMSKKSEWLTMLKKMPPKLAFIMLILACLALAPNFVRWDIKMSPYLTIWAIKNLLFVCIGEESFFRGFIQNNLQKMLARYAYGPWVAIVIAAILFGCYHYHGGILYVVLATVAGIGYGWVYRTQRIEASILTHFSVNLMHFLFFTYPALSHLSS